MSVLFGQNLRCVRKSKGLSTCECARIFGLSQPAWNFYELGTREPKLELVTKICQFFGVSADVLLGLSNESGVPKSSHKVSVDVVQLQDTANLLASEVAAISDTVKKLKKLL